jgi:hypothetical protein
MLRKHVIAAVAGAVGLLGLASTDALAQANNDPTGAVANGDRFLGVQNSTIRIRISTLLANDRGNNIRFRRAFLIPGNTDDGGANPSSAGIARLSRNGNFLLVRLRNDFVGDTSFKYEISAREGRRTVRSRANVFINVLPAVSPGNGDDT